VQEELEKVLSYTFEDKNILKEALTHRSYNRNGAHHNERLEFLGDSVLGLVVAAYLYKTLDTKEEGVLSKIKSNLVSRRNLYVWAANLNIGKYMLLGAGEIATGGRDRQSILSNAMEALIGAIYLDGGFEAAAVFIKNWLHTQKIEIDQSDYKSTLQEFLQHRKRSIPQYAVVAQIGPQHNQIFTVAVTVDGKEIGRGKGNNKKMAEQEAAKEALKFFSRLK